MTLLHHLQMIYCVLFYVIIVPCYLMVLTEEQTKLDHNEDTNPCAINWNSNDVLIDCSHRSLTFINRSWFPESTTKIWLNNNRLIVIPNGAISHMLNLTEVHFENNMINFIESQAFMGLRNLQYLNLDKNQLNIFNLSVDIFSHMTSLTELHLIQNDGCQKTHTEFRKTNLALPQSKDLADNYSFPDKMFANLTNLKSLFVNVSRKFLYFNEDFDNLRNLTTLLITGCVNYVIDESFQHVKFVQNLILTELPNVNNFSDLALGSFKNLSRLTYAFVRIGVHNALHTLRPLVNTNLSYVNFNAVDLKGGSRSDAILNRNGIIDGCSVQYLQQICIEELHLDYSEIMVVTLDAISDYNFEHCLRYLSLAENPIVGTFIAIEKLFQLANLHTLIMKGYFNSNHNWASHLDLPRPKTFPMLSTVQRTVEYKQHHADICHLPDLQNDLNYIQENDHKNDTNIKNNVQTISFFFSDSLEHIDMSALIKSTTMKVKLRISGGKNLNDFYIVDNGLWDFEFPLEGLPKLKNFYLLYNNLSILDVSFFNAHPNLEVLYIDNCILDVVFMSKNSFTLFQNISKLHTLDLSDNSLSILSPYTFLPNTNLTWLNLAANRFRNIPFNLKYTPKLNYLDLKQNALTTIDETEREDLEQITETNSGFQLFLSGNILSCGCEHLPFLQWLQRTNIQLDDSRNYTCMNKRGVLSFTLAYIDLDGLWRECWGQFFFNVSIVLLCFILIGFLLVFIYMKNKTLILSTILQLFTGYKLKKQSDYKYDVFIGYKGGDYRFVCFSLRPYIENDLNLTTFVLDRDLPPGIDLANGVSEAIFSSWRVLLMINDNLLNENDWFLFTIRSAIYSISPNNPARVVILVDNKYISHLPTELLSALPDYNVFISTEWEMSYKLREFLRTRLCCN